MLHQFVFITGGIYWLKTLSIDIRTEDYVGFQPFCHQIVTDSSQYLMTKKAGQDNLAR